MASRSSLVLISPSPLVSNCKYTSRGNTVSGNRSCFELVFCIVLLLSCLFHSFISFGCLGSSLSFLLRKSLQMLCLHQLFSFLPQEFPDLSNVLCSSLIPCLTELFLGLSRCCSLLLLFSNGSSLYPVLCCSLLWGHVEDITHLSEGITEFFYTNHVCSLC